MDNLIVLVHSPLVGPFSWSLVAQQLQAIGFDVLVPTLADSAETPAPYWQQQAASMQQALAGVPRERPLVLIGHSGAGSLLPVLAQASHHPISAYLFVDAGLPHPGQSQLDEMEVNAPAFAHELRQLLASGECFPNWTDEDLSEELPDRAIRQQVLAELQPRSLDFFKEVRPDVPGWPGMHNGYLLFTPGYGHYLEQAQKAGWPSQTLPAGHFHMLVDPVAVALALVNLIKQMNQNL